MALVVPLGGTNLELVVLGGGGGGCTNLKRMVLVGDTNLTLVVSKGGIMVGILTNCDQRVHETWMVSMTANVQRRAKMPNQMKRIAAELRGFRMLRSSPSPCPLQALYCTFAYCMGPLLPQLPGLHMTHPHRAQTPMHI